jgi:hypothetical protein
MSSLVVLKRIQISSFGPLMLTNVPTRLTPRDEHQQQAEPSSD